MAAVAAAGRVAGCEVAAIAGRAAATVGAGTEGGMPPDEPCFEHPTAASAGRIQATPRQQHLFRVTPQSIDTPPDLILQQSPDWRIGCKNL